MPDMRDSPSNRPPNTHKNLYSIRDRLPLLPLPTAVIAALLVCLLSSFSALMLMSSAITALALSAVSSAVFTLLLILCRRLWVFMTAPVVIAVVIIFSSEISDSITTAVFSLLFLIAGLALASCVYLGKSCSATILSVSLVLALWLLICILLFILVTPGLYDFSESVQKNLLKTGQTVFDGLVSSLSSVTIKLYDGAEQNLLSHESATQVVRYLSLLAPSILSLSVMGVAFLAAKTLYGFFVLFGITDLLRDPKWMINPKKSTAYVYCFSYIMAFLFSTSQGMEGIYFAFYNISVIFTAPMAVSGLREMKRKILKNTSSIARAGWVVLILIVFTVNMTLIFTIAAFFGVFTILKKKSPKA